MYDGATEYSFLRMLAKLEAEVRVLDDYFDTLSSEHLERDLNTAGAFLSSLWDKVRNDNIDPYRVHSTLANIEYRLRSIQIRAQAKRNTRPSFWGSLRSAINFVVDVINLVTSIIGLGPVIPRIPALPSSGSPRLLEYTPSYDYDDSDSDSCDDY
jgi:hypothetical protein